jgi:hypothetical protein
MNTMFFSLMMRSFLPRCTSEKLRERRMGDCVSCCFSRHSSLDRNCCVDASETPGSFPVLAYVSPFDSDLASGSR